MRRIKRSYAIWVTLLMFASCNKEADLSIENPKISTTLNKKRTDYMIEMNAACRKEAIIKATVYVDSMIAADFFMQLSGTLPFPDKPLKPVFEGPIIIKDTIKALPILK